MGVTRGALTAWVVRAVALAFAFCLPASSATAAPALHVVPFPSTPDASPLSRVIFSSLRVSDLRSVTVTGSSSGPHLGHYVSLPDGAGTAFVPEHPFAAGERVSVTASLSSPAAGTASGDPGATILRFSFTIAVPVTSGAPNSAVRTAMPSPIAPPSAAATGGPTRSFHSAPNLHPPPVTISSNADTSSGDIFLTPIYAKQNGPMILNSRGQLVWFRPTAGYVANLEVQRYKRHPVLTWWQGQSLGVGEGVIMGASYRVVRILHAGDGYAADVHEFQLTRRGTALIDASIPVKADLTSIGGTSNGNVWDYVIQEVDIRTGELLWEWHALGHVPVSASYLGKPAGWPPFDYFHLNSIQQLPNGNLVVSARDTWAIYEIDKQTGRVIWTLGGKDSSFKMGPGTNFEWQHDAHLTGETLSLFDDAATPQEERQSSAKTLRLNPAAMTASLTGRFTHSPPLLAAAAGSAQLLPDHDVLVGWGNTPEFSEYTASGRQIFSGTMPFGEYSYRVYRFRWRAQPLTPPVLALSAQPNGGAKVFASWNGATQVASWRVLGGAQRNALKVLAHAARSGFETALVLPGTPRYVAVQALAANGRILGTSSVHPR